MCLDDKHYRALEKRQGFTGFPRRERELHCVRNSGGKQCPRGFDAGPVKVHLSDTDEVTGDRGGCR